MSRFPRVVLLAFALLLPAGVSARAGVDADLSEATVRKIDAAGGRVTLRHGYLANLDMPPMTMVFRVADPAWLARMQPGDAIRFAAERIDGAFTVVRLEFAAPVTKATTGDKASSARGDGLAGYRRFRADEPLLDWRLANDEVGRLGGHAGHLPADSAHTGHHH